MPRPVHGERHRRWYLLDNIARLFPPIISPRFTTVFRLSVRLTAPVHIAALHRALDRTWRRFPVFRVQLRRGVFWHYLEECAPGPLQADAADPCTVPPAMNGRRPLVTVLVRGRRIAVEASHVVTDGTGALEFLKTLVVAYAQERGRVVTHHDIQQAGVLDPDVAPAAEEEEYASRREYQRHLPQPLEYRPAWHVGGGRLKPGHYHVTTLRYPNSQLRAVAKALNGSLTDLMVAVFLFALQERYRAVWQPRRRRRPLRILVPVNLRPSTGSKTLRNFFVYVMVELDQRLGYYSLEEIVHSVHHQLRAALDPRNLRRQISRNVRAERNLLVRLFPVVLKDLILRAVFRLDGEAVNTASFSNLGRVSYPSSVAQIVDSMDFLPPPSPITGVNMTMVSTADTVSVSFGSVREEHEVEQVVVETLHSRGAVGTLVTNWGGDQDVL
jgi:hypothetical protein